MRTTNTTSLTILMADDDPDDRMLTRDAFEESGLRNGFETVDDGEELMDYLHCRGAYAGDAARRRPGLILLDLNMPRKDGREALKEIKSCPDLRHIPVVVMTTSRAEEDIISIYDIGVNSFIVKPVTFTGMVEVIKALGEYWFEMNERPYDREN